MKQLYAPTEEFIKIERGVLAADVTAGSNVTIVLESNNGIVEDDYIVIGSEGNELAELQQVNQAISGNVNVRVATLKFSHKKGEPVTKYRFNQRKFYGSATQTGTYVELTGDGSPKDIQVDDPMGTLLEYTGSDYNFFKATYFNSTDITETEIGDSTAANANESLRYATIYAIRKHAGLAGNPWYSDARIEVKRMQAESEINSTLYSRYVLPLTEVPALLTYICELLAAGYIDFEEFGKEGEGVKWLGEARALLKAIQKGTQILIGADGVEITRRTTTGRLEGIPSDSTTEERSFTINQVF